MGRGSHFSKTANGESYLAVIKFFCCLKWCHMPNDMRNNGLIERDESGQQFITHLGQVNMSSRLFFVELYILADIFVASVGSMIYRFGLYNSF